MSEGAETIGAMATAALLAREVDRARHGEPAVGHDEHEACANCGTIRQGPYCYECGQAGHVHRNLMALVHDIAHGVFHFEGKIWNTLPLLAIHPGQLTRRYVAGERAKFVSPIALFLFSVFLMFAVVSNLGGGHGSKVEATKQGIAAEMVKVRAKLDKARTARAEETDPEDQVRLDRKIAELSSQYAAMQPIVEHGLAGVGKSLVEADKVAATADAKIKAAELAGKAAQTSPVSGEKAAAEVEKAAAHVDPSVTQIPYVGGLIAHAAQNPELVVYKMKNYAYKYSWALIPISVPLIWLLFCFRRDVGLYDHAIFGIYSLSFMSLAMVVLAVGSWLGMPGAIIPLAAMIVPPVHMYRQLKGAYGLGRYGALWRTAALLIMTTIALSLFSSFVFYMGTD